MTPNGLFTVALIDAVAAILVIASPVMPGEMACRVADRLGTGILLFTIAAALLRIVAGEPPR
jgi:ABC-type Mn2+/Zn2+ transport system permease subunit